MLTLTGKEWTFLGILISLLIGVVTVFIQLRSRTRTELSFVRNSAIPLFETAVSNLEELSVFYKEEEISQNLVLFQASIVNTGNTDIDSGDCYSPLKVKLPGDFRWTETRKLLGSTGVDVSSTVDGNNLEIEWNLLKPDEHVSIDALVEYRSEDGESLPTSRDISRTLIRRTSAEQRVKDLKEVKDVHSGPKPGSALELVSFTVIFLFFTGMVLWPIFSPFLSPEMEVEYSVEVNNQLYSGRFSVSDENELIFQANGSELFFDTDDPIDLIDVEVVEAPYDLSVWGISWRSVLA